MTKQINKVNFLIHPGWFYEYAVQDAVHYEGSIDEQVREAGEKMLDSYLKHVKSIGEDEILFVFATSSVESMLNMKDEGFGKSLDTLREIKGQLGRRAIIITDPLIEISSGGENVYKKARQMALARGFEFGKDVTSEAFGEQLGNCVENGAEKFNEIEGFSIKTLIRPELSDAPHELFGEYDPKAHEKEMLEGEDGLKRVRYN
ncbi:hypothetical protein HN358_01295 [Candidatus Uhrbacteria bacterium]|nr:hypothetical protein [Candidatus Uhrbacteria bacterium]MBT7717333.1 hypothetical protein [Candidatus Uhrbacteria bacterium]